MHLEKDLLYTFAWEEYAGELALITDATVAALHGERLLAHLQQKGIKARLLTMPPGEIAKTRETKAALEDALFAAGFGKNTLVVGLGGGVVCDVAGFVAATYCRGVPLILCPTTLLAMVDASSGGKNGVNTAHGKNLIGTIYEPMEILMDPSLLTTLPGDELKNGFAEMIKHGLIADPEYYAFLKKHAHALQKEVSREAIVWSFEIKRKIVAQDPLEKGLRRLLNLGHTVAHALERHTGYAISHGVAVAMGIVAEGRLAVERGYLSERDLEDIRETFFLFGFNTELPVALESLWPYMAYDKKAENNIPRFVFLEGIGKPLAFDGAYCSTFLKFQ